MPLFFAFHVFCLVCFQEQNLHFAPFCLSRWSPTHNFSAPQNPLLAPKTPLFNSCFAPFSHVFHGTGRYYLYNRSGYLYFSPCIQRQKVLHLSPFYLAFSTKTHCIQHQNALHLAPKRTVFSGILHRILLQIAQKLVQMVVLLNKYPFYKHLQSPPFCIKTNLRENRLFAVR